MAAALSLWAAATDVIPPTTPAVVNPAMGPMPPYAPTPQATAKSVAKGLGITFAIGIGCAVVIIATLIGLSLFALAHCTDC